jgi:hypothetical protein
VARAARVDGQNHITLARVRVSSRPLGADSLYRPGLGYSPFSLSIQAGLMMRARALPALTFRRPRLKTTLPHNIAGHRLLIGLVVAVATVAALQNSPLARALQAGLASLDFDRSRGALLSAWIFCFAMALLAGALTGPSLAFCAGGHDLFGTDLLAAQPGDVG